MRSLGFSHASGLVFALLIVSATSCEAVAIPITFRIEGTVDTVPVALSSDFDTSQTLSGNYTFDSTTPDLNPSNPNQGQYVGTGVSFAVGPSRVTGPAVVLNVSTGLKATYSLNAGAGTGTGSLVGPSIAGLPVDEFEIFLNDTSGSALSSDALPLIPLSLGLFDTNRWSLSFDDGSGPGRGPAVDGTLTSISSFTENIPIAAGTNVTGIALGGTSVVHGVEVTFEDTGGGDYGAAFHSVAPDSIASLLGTDSINFLTTDGAAQAWELSFTGTFTGDATLSVQYDDAALPAGFNEETLALFHFVGGSGWSKLSGLTHDPANNRITATTDSFSPFVLGLVPEPSTTLLLGLGLAGLAVRRTRG